jgi:hypothetical protein
MSEIVAPEHAQNARFVTVGSTTADPRSAYD